MQESRWDYLCYYADPENCYEGPWPTVRHEMNDSDWRKDPVAEDVRYSLLLRRKWEPVPISQMRLLTY